MADCDCNCRRLLIVCRQCLTDELRIYRHWWKRGCVIITVDAAAYLHVELNLYAGRAGEIKVKGVGGVKFSWSS